MRIKRYPIFYQLDEKDCGPACLQSISLYYGKKIPIQLIREYTSINKTGVNLLGISKAAEKLGFNTLGLLLNIDELAEIKNNLPAILHWNEDHFVVLYDIKKNFFGKKKYIIGDPAHGIIKLNEEHFKKAWLKPDGKGVILLLEKTNKFDQIKYKKNINTLSYLSEIINPYKKKLIFNILRSCHFRLINFNASGCSAITY